MKRHLGGLGLAVAVVLTALAPAPARAACGNGGVYVFETNACPYCTKVKMILARHGVPYKTLDATNPRVRAFMIEKFNTIAVPVTVIDDAHVIGFNESQLRHRLCLG